MTFIHYFVFALSL